MENNSSELILVTGASGYIGAHLLQQLLQANKKVRATVRSQKNPKKTEFLYQLVPEKKDNLELVEVELTNPESLERAVEGCKYVYHLASPVTISSSNEDAVVRPAVEGTINILNACLKHNVKKVVITSSFAASWYGNFNKVMNEEDWSKEEDCGFYEKSKLRSEKAAWDFWNLHKNKLEMATILPSFVIGPMLSQFGGVSEKLMTDILTGKIPGLPRVGYGCVDVRDVALAHFKAMENPNSNGKRYLITSDSLWLQDISGILYNEFKPHGYKVTNRTVGRCLLRLVGIFDKRVKMTLKVLGVIMKTDNSKSIKELGMKYRDVRKSVVEMGYSIIGHGNAPNKIKKNK